MSKFMATVILTAALSASALLATAASKPLTKPKRLAASVNVTFASPVALACTTGTQYAANCPGSSGACTCIDVTGTATGGFGRASVTGAITLDNFDATPENGCVPIFGSFTLTNTAASSTTTMDINGALCDATLPVGTKTLGGGFDFDPATVGLSGTGSISGTIDSNGHAALRLVGAIAPAPTPTATSTI